MYDFNSEYLFGLLRYELIASGKSTFSKEVSFKVGGDLIIIKIMILYDFEVLMCFIMKIEYGQVGVESF